VTRGHSCSNNRRQGRPAGTLDQDRRPDGADLARCFLHHILSLIRPGDFVIVDRLHDDRYACWGGGDLSGATAKVLANLI
jgi:methylase of polypeptide subunit release factors